MKCRDCVYMKDYEDGIYMCANRDSLNYGDFTGPCCEDDCKDGEPLYGDESEDEE